MRRCRSIHIGLSVCLGLLLLGIGRPALHLALSAWRHRPRLEAPPPGHADDVSRMNTTPVAEVWTVPAEREAAERQLRDLLRRAGEGGLKVSIAGARHSMGGHTLYPGGIVISMVPFNHLELSADGTVLQAGAGAKWSEIIPFLDRRGRSVEVMQSDSSFTVGGSVSVNCHGWQYGRPPIASTVTAFRLMKADGTIVRCSRGENSELFSLALGGYGLFGILLEVELRVPPNARLRLEQFRMPVEASLEALDRRLREGGAPEMVYARLGVAPDALFREAMVTLYYPDPAGPIPGLTEAGLFSGVKRAVFRGSAGSDYGKELRWTAETRLQPLVTPATVSRNQLLSDEVGWYVNGSPEATDILHEYFVPRAEAGRFVADAQRIIRQHQGDLLNATVRDIAADTDTFLRYAREPVMAFVMFFNQPRTGAADAQMERMTQELIDAALAARGCYYLPYRLHATPEQFRRAYPQAAAFFEMKRRHDPQERFQNQFYLKYGRLN